MLDNKNSPTRPAHSAEAARLAMRDAQHALHAAYHARSWLTLLPVYMSYRYNARRPCPVQHCERPPLFRALAPVVLNRANTHDMLPHLRSGASFVGHTIDDIFRTRRGGQVWGACNIVLNASLALFRARHTHCSLDYAREALIRLQVSVLRAGWGEK